MTEKETEKELRKILYKLDEGDFIPKLEKKDGRFYVYVIDTNGKKRYGSTRDFLSKISDLIPDETVLSLNQLELLNNIWQESAENFNTDGIAISESPFAGYIETLRHGTQNAEEIFEQAPAFDTALDYIYHYDYLNPFSLSNEEFGIYLPVDLDEYLEEADKATPSSIHLLKSLFVEFMPLKRVDTIRRLIPDPEPLYRKIGSQFADRNAFINFIQTAVQGVCEHDEKICQLLFLDLFYPDHPDEQITEEMYKRKTR